MSSDKLKQMVSEVINDYEFTDPSVIASRINRRHESVRVSTKQISDFLDEEYYSEERIREMESRFRNNGIIHG